MSFRRLLLIDSDPAFHRHLYDQLAPYGFEIYVVENSDDPLSQVREVQPEIIFIAVETPDKIGYSLCNRAKKGVARDIPVVLTTSSVPPSGFNSHRKLKVHADEYIDKRIMTAEEVVQKVDSLVGLGSPVPAPNAGAAPASAPAGADLELAGVGGLAAEQAPSGSDFEDAESTHIANPGFLGQLEAETDAAFAALGAENSAPPALEDDPALDTGTTDHGVSAAPDGGGQATDLRVAAEAPAHEDGPSTDIRDAHAVEVAPFSEELAADVDPAEAWSDDERTAVPGSAAEHAALAREAANGSAAVHGADVNGAGEDDEEALDLDELEIDPDMVVPDDETDDVAAAPEAPESSEASAAPETAAPPAPEQAGEDAAGRRSDTASEGAEDALDLGLDDVAELASSEQTGDVEPAAQVAKLKELEREVARLREENERLQSSEESASPYSREREFLNLREVINKKEREVLNLQDELGAREREVLEGKEKLRKLERERADIDAKALELEQKLLEANESIGTLEDEKTGARERAKRLEGELSEARGEIESLREEHPRALAAQKTELETEKQKALEEAEERQRQALERAEEEKKSALEALAGEHREAIEAKDRDHRTEMEALEDRHAGQVARLERESKEGLEEAEARRRRELEEAAAARSEAEAALKSQFAEERDELLGQISGEQAKVEKLESELGQARQQLEERDSTITSIRGQVADLEEQNRSLQEQVLKAHQRIQEEEETVARARKAISVALTVLDDGASGTDDGAEDERP